MSPFHIKCVDILPKNSSICLSCYLGSNSFQSIHPGYRRTVKAGKLSGHDRGMGGPTYSDAMIICDKFWQTLGGIPLHSWNEMLSSSFSFLLSQPVWRKAALTVAASVSSLASSVSLLSNSRLTFIAMKIMNHTWQSPEFVFETKSFPNPYQVDFDTVAIVYLNSTGKT